jgi:hypothetical protein
MPDFGTPTQTFAVSLNSCAPPALGPMMTSKHAGSFWPEWATWALVAVVLTGILTIYATFNDIF